MSSATHTTMMPARAVEVPADIHSIDAWIARFDSIYDEARGDCTRIPWAHARPCPALMSWLNVQASSLVRPGARVAVVGCGLGRDAVALIERGYDVTAFDACERAIDSAKQLHPRHASCFHAMDLRDLPSRMHSRFDLVVEVHTVQSLPVEHRECIAEGIASLLNHHGVLVAIARGRGEDVPAESLDGPPFPLTSGEMESLFTTHELNLVRPIDDYEDDNDPPVRRLRAVFRKG